MLRHRPDLEIVPFRGNVDTRLQKLEDGVADATLLASRRAQPARARQDRDHRYLDPRQFLPAPAQGAIGIEIRDDARTAKSSRRSTMRRPRPPLPPSGPCCATLDGSCRTPIGAFTELNAISCTLPPRSSARRAGVRSRHRLSGPPSAAARIGAARDAPCSSGRGHEFLGQFKG
jgi:hydroxymethylbilane synthase